MSDRIRRAALLEIALYLGAALALDVFIFDGTRFRDVAPHPFWPIVLLIAAQYGTTEGLIAAGAATLALLGGNIPPQSIAQDRYDYLLAILREPVLWFVAATLLGELRMRHVRERMALDRALDDARRREEALRAAYTRVAALKDSLETRVASQLRTAMTMYSAARSLEKQDTSLVLLGVMEVVRTVMNPEKFSLYLLREDVLEVSIAEGWKPEDPFTRVFRAESRLFQEVILGQRVVCAASEADEEVLRKEGVLAGPLMDNENGDVLGMLKVEVLGLFELHFTNVQTFRVLCDWIADAYVNARRLELAAAEPELERHR